LVTKHNDPGVSSQRLEGVTFYEREDGEKIVVAEHGIFIEDETKMYADAALLSCVQIFWHKFFDRYQIE
jgi:hypothetical protein